MFWMTFIKIKAIGSYCFTRYFIFCQNIETFKPSKKFLVKKYLIIVFWKALEISYKNMKNGMYHLEKLM